MPEGITQHQSVEEADEEVELVTASARSMNADRRFNQGRRESIETVINVNGRFAEDGKKNSIPEVPSPGRHYDNVYASIKVDGNSKQHFGDNHYYFQPSHRESASDFQDTGRRTGIHFSFEKRLLSNRRNSAQRMRELYVAKKNPTVSSSLDHLGVYTSYVGVKTPKVQQRLKQMASRFQEVDKLFAAMFAHVIESRDHRDLENILLNIRKEISKHQPKGATAGSDTDDTYLGDLGHYFEDLLSNEAAKSAPQRQETTKKLASFRVTSGTGDSLLQYLQDGLEIPYWEIIIDAISASLANETTLGSGMISLQLRMTRKEMRGLRDGLRDVLAEPSSADESIDAILLGIDKRMAVLDNFTDSRIHDLYDPGLDAEPGHSELADSQNPGDEAVLTSYAQQSTKQLVILTAAIILALIGAFVPFVKGFAISWSDNEPGKKTDSDYWYNISSSIAVIMGNLAMVIPLIKGSWLSAPYVVTWMWFGVGLGCAVMSIVIYPLCNPGWSSLLAFCATIAGFGATLSITMAVGKDETSGQTSAETMQTKGAKSRSSVPQHNNSGKSKFE